MTGEFEMRFGGHMKAQGATVIAAAVSALALQRAGRCYLNIGQTNTNNRLQ